MKDENKINLNDLPEDIQERIRAQYNLTKDKNAIIRPYTNVTINNHNTYNINIFDNKGGIINERDEPLLDQFMRAMGRAAGKTWVWLEKESK